jgi:hypothetical protein
MNAVYENETVKIWIEENIVNGIYKSKNIDLNTAKQIIADRLKICQGKTYPLLADIRNVQSFTKEARDYIATHGTELVSATAILTDSPVNKIIGNFYLTISKPQIPTKLFTNKADAEKWLTNYKKR